MDKWEALLDQFSTDIYTYAQVDVKGLIKVIQTANVLVNEDLAEFELEWIFKSLLYKPINLLNIIQSKRPYDVWCKPIGDSFRLLAHAITKYGDALTSYYKPIVEVCQLSFEPGTQKHALDCLTRIAKRSPLAAADMQQYISALESATTCKAPLALFIGDVCKHQPSTVENEITRIWRIYLNLLESNKNKDTIVGAVLQGILGLFRHFGQDLPIAELGDFYKKISTLLMNSDKLNSVVLSMLEHHADLFRERIAVDIQLRKWLWSVLDGPSLAAVLLSVYNVVFDNFKEKKKVLHLILTSEVINKIGTSTISTYTALRVRTLARNEYALCVHVENLPAVEGLEFELRSGMVSNDVADAVAWSIECGLMNSDKLLQTAVVFHRNVPSSKLRQVIACNLLRSAPDLRRASMILLVSESCQDAAALQAHAPLWQLLLGSPDSPHSPDSSDSPDGADALLLEASKLLFGDFMDYANCQLKTLLETRPEKVPEKLSNLLMLTGDAARALAPGPHTEGPCSRCLVLVVSCVREWGLCAATLACGRALSAHATDYEELPALSTVLTIDGCKDEATLLQYCLGHVSSDGHGDGDGDGDDDGDDAFIESQIDEYQMILSRKDIEPRILSRVVRALAESMCGDDDPWNEEDCANIINLVKKLRSRKDYMTDKDGRIFQRDIMSFLGRHDGNYRVARDVREDMLLVQLKSCLALNLLNPEEGITYKINLGSIFQNAVRDENPYVLQTLLTIISSELMNRKDRCLQSAVSVIFRVLCRAHTQSGLVDPMALHQALLLCDDLQPFLDIISYMGEEISPGVRRMLSDGLEYVMMSDTAAGVAEQLVPAVAEHALMMLDSSDLMKRKAGLYLSESLAAVRNKNTAIVSLMAEMLIKITKTYDQESIAPFESIADTLLEQIELLPDEKIKQLIEKLLEVITTRPNADKSLHTGRVYRRIVDLCLGFLRNIYEYKGWEAKTVLRVSRGSCEVGRGFVLVNMYRVFGFSDDVVSEVITAQGVIDGLRTIKLREDAFAWETVLRALTEFAAVLLKSEREKTLRFLAKLTEKLTLTIITELSKTLITCYNKYRELCIEIAQVDTSFKNWWNDFSLQNVKSKRQQDYTIQEMAPIVRCMKVMLKCFNKQFFDGRLVKSLPALVLQAHTTAPDPTCEDALRVAIQFFTCDEVTNLLTEHVTVGDAPAARISPTYINVFLDYLLEESALDKLECPLVLNDVVKWCLEKASDECCDAVLKLVDKLWAAYAARATFEQKAGLVLDLGRLPRELDPKSAPLTWAIARVVEGGVSERIRLVTALPSGEAYSSAFKSFASLLPTRLRELAGESNAVLRALLDAAGGGDHTLLDIVATLSAGDDSKGWWDEAIDSCMATLALKSDKSICELAYKRCWEGLSTGVCDRLLVPLLRYSRASFCEEFLSGVLSELFDILKGVQKETSLHYEYHKRIVDYTRAFTIIQIAFEKIPHSLESPSTVLYRSLNVGQQMWYLVRQTCKLCVTLRGYVVSPPNASDALKTACRKFQCAAYSCLCSAICCRKPEPKFYDFVFDEKTWSSLVDRDRVYPLRLKARSTVRKIRRAVGVDVTEGSGSASGAASSCVVSTVRTRVFLRTLTDNPLHYDLIPIESQTVKTQDIELADNELNGHECAATVTALVAHASRLDHRKWLQALCLTLAGNAHTNVKYLLAQTICNNKAELSPHAAALREPLFQLIVQTARVVETKAHLNRLHIDVIDTLTSWRDDNAINDTTYLNGTIDILISTIIDNFKNSNVYANLMQCLSRLVLVYGKSVTVSWSILRPYFGDKPTEETKCCLNILMKITKHNIDVSELLPTLLAKLESNDWIQLSKRWGQLKSLASLYGQASAGLYLDRYRIVLDRVRKMDAMDYIKMLYHTQAECDLCCDLQNFKRITDLTRNVPRAERNKCLGILSSYLRRQSSADLHVRGMFDVLKLDELIDDPVYSEAAMELLKSGLRLMSEELRRDLVQQVAGYCQHSDVKLRKAALGVMLKAFQDMFPAQTSTCKRPRRDSTRLIESMSERDGYIDTVVTSLALGVTDAREGGDASAIRAGLVTSLHTDDMSIRFVECFILTVYRATMSSASTLEPQPHVAVSALMQMLFAALRGQELFQKLRLGNGPLEIRNGNGGPSKLLTKSKSYQGTARTSLSTKHRRNSPQHTSSCTSGINVQLPVDDILETLLQFAKVSADAAVSFCVETVKAIRCSGGRGFDFDSIMSRLLADLMTKPNSLTPLVVELSRVFIDKVSIIDGFEKSVEDLKKLTRGSESEGIIKLLLEEVKLRTRGNDYFVLGIPINEDVDVAMADSSRRFSMEELISTFGKLSNWDDMTLQEKRRIEPTIPELWAHEYTFAKALDRYTRDSRGTNTWLDKLVMCFKADDPVQNLRCLKELEKWPANLFTISAMTELITMAFPTQYGLYKSWEINPKLIRVRPSDCLAEWAARLGIRNAIVTKRLQSEGSRSNDFETVPSPERVWCTLANERNLPRLALNCHYHSSHGGLAWLIQEVKAKRALALRDNDIEALKSVLKQAVEDHWMYEDGSEYDSDDGSEDSSEDGYRGKQLLQMKRLLLQLTMDVHDPDTKVDNLLGEANDCWNEFDNTEKAKNKESLHSIHEIVMSYYAVLWKQSDAAEKNKLALAMSKVLGQAIEYNSDKCEVLVAVLLDCLHNCPGLSEEAARTVLDNLETLPSAHPSAGDIRSHLHVFPPSVLSEYPGVTSHRPPSRRGRSADMYRKCFQLVADAGYSLTDYCEKLGRAINNNDREEWKRTFDTMMTRIFNNEFAGDDYRLLNKYKNELCHIYDYDKTDANTKRQTLRNVVSKVDVTSQSVLRLSALCPELARRGLEGDACLSALLGLPDGVNVVYFDERVRVMSGSVRRACVLEARLSDGVRLRLLHKSGDRMTGDASALRLGRILARHSPPNTRFTYYEVTPLGDDSGLMQYLEDHETLGAIISDSYNITQTVPGTADDELILQSMKSSLQRYRKLCSNVPSTCLRSGIEKRSSCIQDFIEKKHRYLDSMAFMTILVWILGLGDRHLYNIMYCVADGSVCGVDWAALMQHGNPAEPAPARLTRNMLALCDTQVLESRLQGVLGSIREAQALLLPMIKVIFKWMGDEFNDKFQYIEGILQGKMLSHEISRDVINKSNEKYKDKYLELFDNVFGDYESKQTYSVEEQVSNLLQHCTDERILSVVRSNWEPWI